MWEVLIRPHERGLEVSITDGKLVSIIGRVAWSRWDATGKFKVGTFKRSLRRVIARADAECARVNAELEHRAAKVARTGRATA